MKNFSSILLVTLSLLGMFMKAQVFAPIATTGYNLDAVAENTTAAATTGGAIDGSNYVLYSVAYGALYSVTTGLPNNGIITSSTYSYQLQPYTQNNLLYLTAGLSGAISLSTPAPYAGLSLLGFATEGTATFSVLLTFTDNTTLGFTGLSFADWFGTGSSILAGFDRTSRNIGTPANATGNPKMYNVDLPINCAGRSKLVQTISVQNTGTNARVCILAVSGTGAPTFSASSIPVTCAGGTNGSASITATGGLPPYTYTWSTNPVQNSALAVGLPVGVYTYSTQDNQGCIVTSTIAVSQSLSPEPPLVLSSSAYTLCGGASFTLGVSGASTYTWSGNSSGSTLAPTPLSPASQTIITYTVSGLTSVNCLRTGSVNITINPLPAASFISSVTAVCKNSAPIQLSTLVQQTGGTFSGPGVSGGNFIPSSVNVGTILITYLRTDANNCSRTATTSIQVSSLSAPSLSQPAPKCANSVTLVVSGTPGGGIFSGPGTSSTGVFDPATALSGNNLITYSIMSGPCTATANVQIVVYPVSTTSISNPKTFYCKTSPASLINAYPTGGVFTGPGMSGAAFSPSKANIGNGNIIIYTFTDLNGCSDSSSVRITVSECAGIEEDALFGSNILIYPNPNNGSFSISSKVDMGINITNELGQIIYTTDLSQWNNYSSQISDLPVGIYFITSKNNYNSGALKVIIQK